MKVEQWSIDRLIPFHNNARIHDEKSINAISASVDRFSWLAPIVVDKEGVIIAGHGRLDAAKQLGMSEVPVLVADWLTENEVAAAREADNMTQDLSFFDWDKLNMNLEDIDWQDIDMSEFGFKLDDDYGDSSLDDRYSDNVGSVLYEPKETDHKPQDLYKMDYARFSEFINKIENGDIREMLLIRANWFAEFNFAKIADYYAYQATKEEKRAFEALGLVLLDRDQLIENGFAEITAFMGADNE